MILISLPHNWKEINSFKGQTIRKLIRGGGGGGGGGGKKKKKIKKGKKKRKKKIIQGI